MSSDVIDIEHKDFRKFVGKEGNLTLPHDFKPKGPIGYDEVSDMYHIFTDACLYLLSSGSEVGIDGVTYRLRKPEGFI